MKLRHKRWSICGLIVRFFRRSEGRIHMNLVGSNENKEGSPTMIPELPVDSSHLEAVYLIDLFEVHKWRVLGAKHPVKIQKVEGPAKNMSLRGG